MQTVAAAPVLPVRRPLLCYEFVSPVAIWAGMGRLSVLLMGQGDEIQQALIGEEQFLKLHQLLAGYQDPACAMGRVIADIPRLQQHRAVALPVFHLTTVAGDTFIILFFLAFRVDGIEKCTDGNFVLNFLPKLYIAVALQKKLKRL